MKTNPRQICIISMLDSTLSITIIIITLVNNFLVHPFKGACNSDARASNSISRVRKGCLALILQLVR